MNTNSLLAEMEQVQLAVDLIELGARLQILETETDISRGRLLRLYKEVRGVSPPKGMLPFSTDWFITWMANIHASLFYGMYRELLQGGKCDRMDAFVKAYRLYLEQVALDEHAEAVLGLTRAWTLIRFFESGLFEMAACTRCHGHYVMHAHTPKHDYVCGICRPPSRAGKTRKRRAEAQAKAANAMPSGHTRRARTITAAAARDGAPAERNAARKRSRPACSEIVPQAVSA